MKMSLSLSLSLSHFDERDTHQKNQYTGHTVRGRIVSWCDHVSERLSLETSGDKDVDTDREVRCGYRHMSFHEFLSSGILEPAVVSKVNLDRFTLFHVR